MWIRAIVFQKASATKMFCIYAQDTNDLQNKVEHPEVDLDFQGKLSQHLGAFKIPGEKYNLDLAGRGAFVYTLLY